MPIVTITACERRLMGFAKLKEILRFHEEAYMKHIHEALMYASCMLPSANGV